MSGLVHGSPWPADEPHDGLAVDDGRPDAEELRALELEGNVQRIPCRGCKASLSRSEWRRHVCPWTYLTDAAANAARGDAMGRAA